ncbi:undecaprenyl pyrophosphate phosphatase [compost metagenome]
MVVIALIFLALYGKEGTFLWVNQHNKPLLDKLFFCLTYLGDGVSFVILILVFLFTNKQWFYTSLLSLAATTIVAQLIKLVVHEYRPYMHFHDKVHLHLLSWVNVHQSNSFPSGHTVTAFSMALILSCFVNNKRWSMLFVLLAALAGYSRVYLSQHFLSDVSTGSFIGVTVTLMCVYAVKMYYGTSAIKSLQ